MTFEEKYNQCVLKARKYIEDVKEIDPTLKVLIVVDDGQISLIQSSNPSDLSEAFGLIRVTDIRLQEQERRLFNRRMEVTEAIEKIQTENFESVPKERMH